MAQFSVHIYTMTPQQIRLLHTSFTQVLMVADELAAQFYDRVFELDPSLKVLFRRNMHTQGRELMGALSVAIHNLHDPSAIRTMLHSLGRRHMHYGVTTDDYIIVGIALMDTLADGLGDKFTPETRTAWQALYQFIAETMQEAGQDRFQIASPRMVSLTN